MVSASSALPKVEEERYLALLRTTNAIATSNDCGAACETFVRELRDVTPFAFLHVVTFDQETGKPCWSLLEANGERAEPSVIEELSDKDSSIQWVHGSGQILATPDWSNENPF